MNNQPSTATWINYDDVAKGVYSVDGPHYPRIPPILESPKIENPGYNVEYEGDYPYMSGNALDAQKDGKPEFVKWKKPPPARPPLPTSEIPHSRNVTCLDHIIIFFFDYWRHLLVGLGVLLVLAGVSLLLFFVVWKKPAEEVRTTTEEVRTTTTTEEPSPFCPIGFHFINDKCWKIINETERTNDAKKFCEGLGSYLVTIKSAEENESLGNYFGNSSSIWIGLTCAGQEASQCKWFNGKNIRDNEYTNFADGDPTWLHGECVYYSHITRQWVSAWCSCDSLPFVCETPKIGPTTTAQPITTRKTVSFQFEALQSTAVPEDSDCPQ